MKAAAYRAWPHASHPAERRYSSSDPDDPDDLHDLHDPDAQARRPCLTEDEDHISPIESIDVAHGRLYNYLSGSDGEGEGGPRRRVAAQRPPRPLDRDTLGSADDADDNHYSRINDPVTMVAPACIPPIPPPPLDDLSRPQVPPRSSYQVAPPNGLPASQRPADFGNDSSDAEFTSQFLMRTPSGSIFLPPAQPAAAAPERLSLVPHPRAPLPPAVQPLRWTPTPLDPAIDSSGQESNTGTTRTGPSAASSSDRSQSQSKEDEAYGARPGGVYMRTASGVSVSTPLPVYHSGNDFCDYGRRESRTMKDRLTPQCSWRSAALVLAAGTALLTALLIYFTAMKIYHLDWKLQPIFGANGESTSLGNAAVPLTMRFGDSASHTISPDALWPLQLELTQSQFVLLNISLPSRQPAGVGGASPAPPPPLLGLYGRRGTTPTHIRYDFLQVLDASRLPDPHLKTSAPQKRSVDSQARVPWSSSGHVISFVEYMEKGTWFISFYNDNEEPQMIVFTVSEYDEEESSCPSDCHGRGDCEEGQCQCEDGYQGWDCSQTVCPVLCRGNGVYVHGACRCYDNWKGADCGVRVNECEDPACSGNGECVAGVCVCTAGYQGALCADVDCLTPDCSANGVCRAGLCFCFDGYRGNDCSLQRLPEEGATACVDCSGHGEFNFERRQCQCEDGWGGGSCETETCTLECAHGVCASQRCICADGWSGATCDQLRCDSRCERHGFCTNGTCVCKVGWNGRHCTLDGCPNACNNHGTCQRFGDGWRCNCRDAWKGHACSIAMETDCANAKDDDSDGLLDCDDPDCCMSISCKDAVQCLTSADPMEILLRKQPPSSTTPFYGRMRFLIEDDSVQSYATESSFNHSQVSVIRGKVMSIDGSHLIGVRVSVETQPLYGFTLTRDLGLFDLLVNGGGSVTLNFQRHPFMTRRSTVLVPWNQLVTMPAVAMTLDGESERPLAACEGDGGGAVHERAAVQPVVHSTWHHTQLGACPTRTTVIPESQVLQESVRVAGTGVFLVYHSSESPGYMSTLGVVLTAPTLPPRLSSVLLRVTVEGLVFERLFEATASLAFRFAWDRRNAYNQKVYGIVTAVVSIGYKYTECERVFWEYQTATMSGYDITSSEIGGWNLHMHHTYNFEEGILHKGDGANIYLKSLPRRVTPVAGDGRRRPANCRGCNGPAPSSPLLAPGALACGLDGSLYIGDFDHVRKVSPDRSRIMSILQLRLAGVSHRYYMAVSPLDGKLYLSEHEGRRIVQVKTMGAVRGLSENAVTIAGGDGVGRCVPGADCGDGGPARRAPLFYPKGIAIDKDGFIYFADGANIRVIDPQRNIRVLVGSQTVPRPWRPLACGKSVRLDEVTLKWPTALAVNPLDNTLHIVDDDLVLKVTSYHYLVVVAGRPAYCPQPPPEGDTASPSKPRAVDVALVAVQHIAFASNGDLYIVESDGGRVNRVRVVTTDGLIQHVTGADSGCDCRLNNCTCYDPKQELAAQMLLAAPAAVAVSPSGVLHVSDSVHRRVYAIHSPLPPRRPRGAGGAYRVVEAQHEHRFNRFGQHTETRDLLTGTLLYAFKYSVSSYYGKLSTVTDDAGTRLTIHRDYAARATSITCGGDDAEDDLRVTLSVDQLGQLDSVTSPGGATVRFGYGGAGGSLLSSREGTDGRTFLYEYDANGRLATVVQPTGERMDIGTDTSQGGAVTTTTDVTMTTHGNSLALMRGESETRVSYGADGGLVAEWPYRLSVALEPASHPLHQASRLGEHRLHGVRRLVVPRRTTHRLEWKHFLRRERGRDPATPGGEGRVGRRMRVGGAQPGGADSDLHGDRMLSVNGEPVLTVEYDRASRSELLRDAARSQLLRVVYTPSGLPTAFEPPAPVAGANASYDGAGRLRHWHRAGTHLEYRYDRHGNLTERRANGAATYRYTYEAGTRPTTVTLADGSVYRLHYDHHSNLQAVVTPTGGVHRFQVRMAFGLSRQLYHPPGGAGAYSEDYTSDGRLQQVRYPSGLRRSTYYYSATGQPSSVHFDQSDITFTYYARTNVLHKIHLADLRTGSASTLTFEPEAALIERHTVQFAGSAGLMDAEFAYNYDAGLRLTRISGRVGTTSLGAHEVAYDGATGRVLRMAGFTFDGAHRERCVIEDARATMMRSVDALGRTTAMRFRFSNHAVFTLESTYDAHGRLRSWRRKVGAGDIRAFLLAYDAAGRLSEVVMDDRLTWSMTHDANGNMVELRHHADATAVEFDARDAVTRRGDATYAHDADGFMTTRDTLDRLEHDSRGRLTRVTGRDDTVTLRCTYDPYGRLVATGGDGPGGAIVQYLYADVTERDRVTHTYEDAARRLTAYLYDERGRLFAMTRWGGDDEAPQTFYIALDPSDSPIVVFNARGSVEKQLHYDPLGATTSDSDPDFLLAFGYRAGIILRPSSLILVEGRAYDPHTARFTAPDYSRVVADVAEVVTRPDLLNLYRMVPPGEEDEPMLDVPSWLDALGYDLEALMPPVSFSGRIEGVSPAERGAPNCLLAVRSAFECAFERDMKSFLRISTVPQSVIVSPGDGRRSRFVDLVAPAARVFGAGVVVSTARDGAVAVDLLRSADEGLARLATVLFNNSLSVAVRFTRAARDLHYFVRPSVTDAADDVAELALGDDDDDGVVTVGGVNVTVHRHRRTRTTAPHHIDVRLHARRTSLHLRYGTTVAAERRRVLAEAQRHAVDAAWRREAAAARDGGRPAPPWTPDDLRELKRDGRASRWRAQLLRDANSYPELADDPNNVEFVER